MRALPFPHGAHVYTCANTSSAAAQVTRMVPTSMLTVAYRVDVLETEEFEKSSKSGGRKNTVYDFHSVRPAPAVHLPCCFAPACQLPSDCDGLLPPFPRWRPDEAVPRA